MSMYEFNQRDDCTELRIFAYAILNDPIKIKAEYKKLHIIIEQGASTSIIDAVYAMHQEISMIVSSGATLCYYMNGIIAQEKQCARTMNITIAENACVAVISSLQCAGFFSLRCTALLSGAKAYFFAGSTIMVLPTGNYFQQITQKHTHSQTGSDSRLYGIVETMGRLESNGLITVESKADRSIAEHSSKCLTAGVGAKAFAKPMLEIVPKNVFVKHGAAIGPLDIGLLRALYYRGIQPDEAKKLLKRAFLAQIKAFWPDWVKNSSRGFPFESAF